MNITFGYQYVNFDPEHIERTNEQLSLKRAFELFTGFPWEEQFEKIGVRWSDGLTSTTPSIYFFKEENHFLSIDATNDEAFSVDYRNGNLISQLYIPNDFSQRPNGISCEQLIEAFFYDTVDSILELFNSELPSNEEIVLELKYSKGKLLLPLLICLAPLFMIFSDYDPNTVLQVMGFSSSILLILTLPNLYLNFSYYKNDTNRRITYHPASKVFKIEKADAISEYKKSEIEVELVRTPSSQRAFRYYSYLRFITPKSNFVITHMTAEPAELLQALYVNHRDIPVFFPALRLNQKTEEDKITEQRNFEKKKAELLETYSNWETEKLQEVVRKPDHYADYARAAATEILNKRKSR